jgi:sterol desaturase/sphingolipid hydroxylase (fatty acid hydroxylase superfamily)
MEVNTVKEEADVSKLYRDFFLFPDISILILLITSLMILLFWKGITVTTLVYLIAGMLTFALSEYLTHRFVFHIKAPKNPVFLKFMKRIHYDHHTDPNDLKLLFLPLWYSLPNFLILSAIFYFFSSNLVHTAAYGTGLMSMLLIYEWKHYVAHRPIKPKTRFGQWVKKVHILHHFKNENYWFGVSSPFADFLFGTFKNEKEVESSNTARDLEHRA